MCNITCEIYHDSWLFRRMQLQIALAGSTWYVASISTLASAYLYLARILVADDDAYITVEAYWHALSGSGWLCGGRTHNNCSNSAETMNEHSVAAVSRRLGLYIIHSRYHTTSRAYFRKEQRRLIRHFLPNHPRISQSNDGRRRDRYARCGSIFTIHGKCACQPRSTREKPWRSSIVLSIPCTNNI